MTALLLLASDAPHSAPGRERLRRALGPLGGPLRACALGAAHGDDPQRMQEVAAGLSALLGGPCAAPALSDPHLPRAAALAALEQADVLYLDGGDTLALVRAVEAHGLLAPLRAAARAARLVVGLSAGAAAAGPFTNGWDETGTVAHRVPCLELGFPFPVDVHDEEDDWPEARALLEVLAREGEPAGQVLVIPTGGAVLLDERGLRGLGAPPCQLRRLGAGGAWDIERVEVG